MRGPPARTSLVALMWIPTAWCTSASRWVPRWQWPWPPSSRRLRSPFASLAEMGHLHYPFFPLVGFLLRDRFASIEQIPRVRCPVLIIAGEQDQIVPPAHSRRLYEAAHDPKEFELIPGADHNDLELLAGRRLIDRVVRFAANALGRDRGEPT